MPFSLPFIANGAHNCQRVKMSYLSVSIFYRGSAHTNDTAAETS